MVSAHRPEEQTVTVFHIPELLRRRTVVRTLCFYRSGCGFHPWLGKLRSHMPCGAAKKKKTVKKNENMKTTELFPLPPPPRRLLGDRPPGFRVTATECCLLGGLSALDGGHLSRWVRTALCTIVRFLRQLLSPIFLWLGIQLRYRD